MASNDWSPPRNQDWNVPQAYDQWEHFRDIEPRLDNDGVAATMFYAAMYEKDSDPIWREELRDQLADYLEDHYEIDFWDEFDWDEWRDWYDSQ